jgi:hypothetical protein
MPKPRTRPRFRCRFCGVTFSACPGLKLSGAGEPDGARLSPRQHDLYSRRLLRGVSGRCRGNVSTNSTTSARKVVSGRENRMK